MPFSSIPTRRRVLAGFAAAGVLSALPAWAATGPTADEVAYDPELPALGNPKGRVTIAEFADFQCPSCKFCYGEVQKVLADDPDLRFVLRDWPIFGKESRAAAMLVLATAGQGGYARAVDALMTNPGAISRRRTHALLRDAGIDVDRAEQELAQRQGAIDDFLARTEAQAHAFALQGTPAFVIGGRLFRRGLYAKDIRAAVAAARAALPADPGGPASDL